jgi:GxGYxYP putative glycoside hydrolase C-terminal domain/GxGYxY sequence motif in domain of unknown function N-terminal
MNVLKLRCGFVLLAALVFIALNARGQTSTPTITWAENQLLPSSATPASLEYLDLEKVREDERNLFVSLQGLVNREQPRIYVTNGNSDEGKLTWLKYAKLEYRRITDPYSLLTKYQSSVRGLVVYDPKQPATINLATTLAGLSDLLVVSPTLAAKLKSAPYNLPIREDLRGAYTSSLQVYQAIYDKFWSRTTHRILVGLDPAISGYVRDYAVANRAAVIWLDARKDIENALLRRFLADMPASAPYLGWFPMPENGGEQVAVNQLSSFGLSAIASNYSENLTVFSGQSRVIKIKPAPAKPKLENKIYVSMMISDGDNIQYDQHYMRRLWNDPKRGQIAIGWTVSPLLLDAAPGMLNAYYASATDNDNLISGPSGAGYAYPNSMPADKLEVYTARTGEYMGATGLQVITLWQNTSGVPSQEVGDAYARNGSNILGISNQISSGTRWFGDLPNFGLNNSYSDSAYYLSNTIRLGSAGFEGTAPRFVGVQGIAWSITPTILYNIWQTYSSDPRYVLVRPDHFFQLIREARGLSPKR